MAPSFVLSHQAYLSLLLHAAKHPHQPVNGVLLTEEGSTGDSVFIRRAIPLLHNWTSLSPMMEIGLDLAATYASESDLKIAGYYQASPNLGAAAFGPVGEKILSKLRQSNPSAIGLLIQLDELLNKTTADAPALSSNPPAQISLQNSKSPQRAIHLIGDQNLQEKFADFDDHLENVKLDWLKNPDCADSDWTS